MSIRRACLLGTTRGSADVPPVKIPVKSTHQPRRSSTFKRRPLRKGSRPCARNGEKWDHRKGRVGDKHLTTTLGRQKTLQQFQHLSTLDLRFGFHNVQLDEASKELTCFCVPKLGIFRPHVLPFGLKVSPIVFQNIVERACRRTSRKETCLSI